MSIKKQSLSANARIGDILVRENVISPEQLRTALLEQKQTGKRLGEALISLGYIDENHLVTYLSRQYGVPAVNLELIEVTQEAIKLVPRESAIKYKLIPVTISGSSLVLAMSDPSDIFAIDDLKFATGRNIEVVVSSEQGIKKAIDRHYGTQKEWEEKVKAEQSEGKVIQLIGELEDFVVDIKGDQEIDAAELERASEQAPVIRLVNHILLDAIDREASDIHIEPYEKEFRVRYRIDGVLYDSMCPPLKLKNAVVSRVKVMANLNIAERRLPQDGRIKLKHTKGKNIEFRVSVIPTIFGEKIAMRILDKDALHLDLTKLGFEPEQLASFRHAILKPYGMVLLTGPTGSGKTTTLYSGLMELNKTDVNISTAEDPVEYSLTGVNQVQVHDDIGLTFSACLRAFLRQDPDIILVGEIRDHETAEIAIKAALTGHLVLSTLHTNDAPSSITRLINMGIEPFLVNASLNAIVAQRLIRKLCMACREEVEVPEKALIDLGVSQKEASDYILYKGKGEGCKNCLGTGYKGRIAVYEVMTVTDELREMVLKGTSTAVLKREAIRQGMKTLRQSALAKLKQGVTTIEEVVRTTAEDN